MERITTCRNLPLLGFILLILGTLFVGVVSGQSGWVLFESVLLGALVLMRSRRVRLLRQRMVVELYV